MAKLLSNKLANKLFIIISIALVLLIPLSMISSKIAERNTYLNQAKQSVASSWTSSQKIIGPIIVIPYTIHHKHETINTHTNEKSFSYSSEKGKKLILPDRININATVNNEIRYKGIYKVPVYTALVDINASLNQKVLEQEISNIKSIAETVKMGRAYLITMVSDPRGINSIPTLNWQEQDIPFNPSSLLARHPSGIHAYLPDLNKINSDVNFNFQLELRGMEELSFVPIGLEAKVKVNSSWPHPEFIGMFLPVTRTVNDDGYQAQWKVTSFASNIAEKVLLCEHKKCAQLFANSFGVNHVQGVDVYLQSERSIKYGFLFIGLTFISFFIFETIKKLPIHAIQYTLVGSAIAIFYLLLVSLSEHLKFIHSYLIATICCIALILYYLRYVLGNFKLALLFSTMLLILYALLFVIISAEDYAFLMGAVLTFVTLGVVMISTRNIDWYNINEQSDHRE